MTSGSEPMSRSLFGMKRTSVLISNDSVVRILAISSVRLRFDEELAGLAGDDLPDLVLRVVGRRGDVAGDVGQADLAREPANALFRREHGAHASGERLLDQLGDQVLEARADRLGQLVVVAAAAAAATVVLATGSAR